MNKYHLSSLLLLGSEVNNNSVSTKGKLIVTYNQIFVDVWLFKWNWTNMKVYDEEQKQ